MGLRTKLGLKKPLYTPVVSIDEYRAPATPQIPRILHFVWVGDETRRPDAFINSWRDLHPEWEVRIWGNDDLAREHWRLRRHIDVMWKRELPGVADMMRYEILLKHGGIALDADGVALRPIPEWVLNSEAIAASENEIDAPGMLAMGFLGTVPGNPFFEALVAGLEQDDYALHKRIWGIPIRLDAAWKRVGPRYLTKVFREQRYTGLTVLPSHFFFPDTKRGFMRYTGCGEVYAYQYWNSTFGDN